MLRLKFLRITQGITQWKLSQLAEISAGRYSMIERGLVLPTDVEQGRIARALNADPASLLHTVHAQHTSPSAVGA